MAPKLRGCLSVIPPIIINVISLPTQTKWFPGKAEAIRKINLKQCPYIAGKPFNFTIWCNISVRPASQLVPTLLYLKSRIIHLVNWCRFTATCLLVTSCIRPSICPRILLGFVTSQPSVWPLSDLPLPQLVILYCGSGYFLCVVQFNLAAFSL